MIEVLAALAAAAASGIRIALPLLLIGLLQGNEWAYPLLSNIPKPVVLGALTSFSLVELLGSKQLLGQRLLQLIELIFSPIAGAIMASAAYEEAAAIWLIMLIGSLLAFVLQLVQTGWFYRWRSLPLWFVFIQDALCILLVFFALEVPQLGGLIALILLWWAVRISRELFRWYFEQQQ